MKKRPGYTAWYGKLEDAEKYPDVKYWQSQPHQVVFDAVWEMVVDAHKMKGEDLSESRLQRTVGGLYKRES